MPDHSDYGASAYVSPLMSMALQNLMSTGHNRESLAAAMDEVEVAMAFDDIDFDERVQRFEKQTDKVQEMVYEADGLITRLQALEKTVEQFRLEVREHSAKVDERVRERAVAKAKAMKATEDKAAANQNTEPARVRASNEI